VVSRSIDMAGRTGTRSRRQDWAVEG
jgi:hypothetical protein